MGTYRLATGRAVGNPVRVQQWNASVRAGDDFKVALTVYDEDGAPAKITPSRARLVLAPDRGALHHDYGLGWMTSLRAEAATDGYLAPKRPGGINFALRSEQTAGLDAGRYRIGLHVDLLDGSYTQIEGILQVRSPDGMSFGHVASFFQLDRSPLDGNEPLAEDLAPNGVPVDADGFYLLGAGLMPGGRRPDSQYFSAMLGDGPLRWMVLADDGPSSLLGVTSLGHIVLAPDDQDTPYLGVSTTNRMILAADDGPPPPPLDPPPLSQLLGPGDGAPLLGADGAPLLFPEVP